MGVRKRLSRRNGRISCDSNRSLYFHRNDVKDLLDHFLAVCKRFTLGGCKYGDGCWYQHRPASERELSGLNAIKRPKSNEACRRYNRGYCKYENVCWFQHVTEECYCDLKRFCKKRHRRVCRNEKYEENGNLVQKCEFGNECEFKPGTVSEEENEVQENTQLGVYEALNASVTPF